jgi:chemotaxis-related protein WspB
MKNMTAGKSNSKNRLLLMFHISGKKYAIDATSVEEIIPLVRIESIAESSDSIIGYINYRGTMIPVIDLALQLTGEPSRKLLSTRIIVINSDFFDNGNTLIGMIAEKVTETKHIDESDIKYPMIEESEKNLNGILHGNEGIIRRLRFDNLLPDSFRSNLLEITNNENDI